MERIEYRNVVDKSAWPRGEWDDEPDKVQWPDEATGLPCLIVRGPSGALCGYVGVADGHPLHGVEYSQCPKGDACDSTRGWCDHRPESLLEAHGGITFTDACSPSTDESRGICHQPAPGEPDHVWWFGFDCAHSGDLCPKYDRRSDGRYRDIAYVARECGALARQLADVAARSQLAA